MHGRDSPDCDRDLVRVEIAKSLSGADRDFVGLAARSLPAGLLFLGRISIGFFLCTLRLIRIDGPGNAKPSSIVYDTGLVRRLRISFAVTIIKRGELANDH
jgi:hypothetical protein